MGDWRGARLDGAARHYSGVDRILFQFLAVLAITYLSARRGREKSYFRRALVWAGGIAVLPLCAVVASGEHEFFWKQSLPQLSFALHAVGFLIAFVLPLLAAFLLRGKGALRNLGYALWVYVVSRLDGRAFAQNLTSYALCALAAIGLVMVWPDSRSLLLCSISPR
jgi:hypothetical protein